MSYPSGLKIYIDDVDVTYYIFGDNTFDPSDDENEFRDIDITPYLRKIKDSGKTFSSGRTSNIHNIRIEAASGNGRVECRVEIG